MGFKNYVPINKLQENDISTNSKLVNWPRFSTICYASWYTDFVI